MMTVFVMIPTLHVFVHTIRKRAGSNILCVAFYRSNDLKLQSMQFILKLHDIGKKITDSAIFAYSVICIVQK